MRETRRPGWWYPYIFVGAFAVVVAVNLSLVVLANRSFPGVTVDHPYERGLIANQALEAARRQEELGWIVETVIEPIPDGTGAVIAQTYRDRDGRPIEGLRVRVRLTRPTGPDLAREAVLNPSGPGAHAAIVPLPQAGQWDLHAEATGRGAPYQTFRRFFLP
ncbi:FixH family protein [Phaeospirillum tilakii]|uniref:FixH family protein n=1 Tax=Phaeospirillum tilakii TaxID=741673 RepID=A0ABW5CFE9_9PROT